MANNYHLSGPFSFGILSPKNKEEKYSIFFLSILRGDEVHRAYLCYSKQQVRNVFDQFRPCIAPDELKIAEDFVTHNQHVPEFSNHKMREYNGREAEVFTALMSTGHYASIAN